MLCVLREALEAIVGRVDHLEVASGGYTPAERVVADDRNGRSVFAKRAADDFTAQRLRREHDTYEALGDQPFAPAMLGWSDGERLSATPSGS